MAQHRIDNSLWPPIALVAGLGACVFAGEHHAELADARISGPGGLIVP